MHVVAYALKNGSAGQNDITAKIPSIISQLKAQDKNCKTLDTLSEKEIVEQGTGQLRHLNAITVKNSTVHILKHDIINYYAQAI